MKFKNVCFLCLCAHSALLADVVEKIEYEGLDRVELAAIQDALTIHPNKSYTDKDIDESIKALYAKDFFSDIKLSKKGNTLVVQVKERPMVDKVAFEGNDEATDDMLKRVVQDRLGSGKLYSDHLLKEILADLQMAYKVWGYYSPTIIPQAIKHEGNKIDIVFKITEGSKTTIKKIIFIGNKTFSDDDLKEVMSLKEARAWRFWNYESHIFREDRVDVDSDEITKFYKSKGFPFFMITSTHVEMSQDKKSHYLTFTMEEGDLYHIGDVSLTSEVDKVKLDELNKLIEIKSGDIYNETLIDTIKDEIRKKVSLQERPFIDVLVDTKYDKEKKIASISYKIVNSQKVFVERINIVGNVRTLDRVIRREIAIHEGDALNPYKIQRSIDRLKGMEYFEDVQVEQEEGSAPDKRVVNVNVKEKDTTSQFRFGIDMNDADGIGGFINLIEHNLFGTGRSVSADVMWMQRYHGIKFDVFDPRFFDQNVGAGLRIGGSRTDRKHVSSAAVRSLFISPYIRYLINEHLSHRIGYTVAFNKRTWWNATQHTWQDRPPETYQVGNRTYKLINKDIAKDEYGKYTTCELSSVLTYFQVDNPYEPRDGYDVSLTNAFAGIFGNVRYLKNILEGNFYKPVTNKITFVTNGQLGHIIEMKNTRSSDRFALGGGPTMRGFDTEGVSARLPMNEIVYDATGNEISREHINNSLGSKKYWTVSFMLKAPLSSKEMGINGVVFLDFGSAWGTKYDKKIVQSSSAIRASTGVAIEWEKCPLGMPMSFIFGVTLKKKSYDEKQTFTLSGLM